MNSKFTAKSFNENFSNDQVEIGFNGSLYNNDSSLHNCEFIYDLYLKFDTGLFKKLDGVFTVYIYQKNENKLYISRDRVGISSLYFYENKNSIIFGQNLKEFYKESSFEKDIDFSAVYSYLQNSYIRHPYSIFKNTKKITPGFYLEYDFNLNKSKEIEFWSYEKILDNNKPENNEKKVINTAHDLLLNSIQKRVKTDQNFASTLSGGYDSSIIATILNEISEKKIDTFTIGFDQHSINEAKDARKIASFLNTNHHEHYFTPQNAMQIVPKLCEIFDEPFADFGATPTVLMTKQINKNGFSSMYVGEGGDEVFATADNLINFERLGKIPKPIKSGLFHLLNKLDNKKTPNSYKKALEILKAENIPSLIQAKNLLFNKYEIDQLLLKKTDFITVFDKLNFSKNIPLVDQITGTHFKTSMVDTVLIKCFQSTQNFDLIIKEPFLDIDLISYMSKIPQSLKIKNGSKKYILKQIAYKYIDKKLLDRPKKGFDIPFSSWMRGVLKELVYENINEKRLIEENIFDVNFVINLRESFYNGDDSKKYKLWTIFIFQMWYRNIK